MTNASSSARIGIKRGLVLEGGGGKGAYEIGAVAALIGRGITFDCISGTSVGALNGAFIGCDRVNEAIKFWAELSPAKVRTWRRPATLFITLELLHVFCLGGSEVLGGKRPKVFRFCALCLLAMTTFCYNCGLNRWLVFTSAIVVITLIFLSLALPAVLRELNFAVFRTSPLRAVLNETLLGAAFSKPLYAAVSKRISFFDPDHPTIYHLHDAGPGGILSKPVEIRAPEERFVPNYIRVDVLGRNQQVDALMASTALPYGIFPEVRSNGISATDGGTSDNLPIFPLLEYESCDEIWVVSVNPVTDQNQFLRKQGKRLGEIKRVMQLASRSAKSWWDAFNSLTGTELPILPLREYARLPERIVLISPRNSLGGFITGTLNFTRSKARSLVRLGAEDAARVADLYLTDKTAPGLVSRDSM